MSQQQKFMVSPRALQLAQNNYDISNAHFAHRVTQSSPYLAQIRSISRTLSRTHIARPADTDMSGKLTQIQKLTQIDAVSKSPSRLSPMAYFPKLRQLRQAWRQICQAAKSFHKGDVSRESNSCACVHVRMCGISAQILLY